MLQQKIGQTKFPTKVMISSDIGKLLFAALNLCPGEGQICGGQKSIKTFRPKTVFFSKFFGYLKYNKNTRWYTCTVNSQSLEPLISQKREIKGYSLDHFILFPPPHPLYTSLFEGTSEDISERVAPLALFDLTKISQGGL